MRLYTFINFYLSSIQQGIQTAHVTHELFNRYVKNDPYEDILLDWARNHKTIITLNGGNNKSIKELLNFFDDSASVNPYPYTSFHEDEDSLGGLMTGVGIVLPSRIYDAAELVRKRKWSFFYLDDVYRVREWSAGGNNTVLDSSHSFSQFEVELIDRMNQCPLAR